jgi:exodeoxyribonuclease-5
LNNKRIDLDKSTFHSLFLSYFSQQPTDDQEILMDSLIDFVFNHDPYPLFLLKGYAGTGKTTMLGAFVKTLLEAKARVKLLAPTGRAAKVLGGKSNLAAFTIHKFIYRRAVSMDGAYKISLMPNLHKHTLFIVDEASMISSGAAFGGGDYTLQNDGEVSGQNLLEDLVEYVYSGVGCKLILLGDEGQLPPVGADYSPALHLKYLEQNFPKCTITETRLSQVVRQDEGSSVLLNATALRSAEEGEFPKFTLEKKGDLIRLPGDEIQERIEDSFNRVGVEETILITRSNKRANQYNQLIRSAIFDYEEELCSGDLLMAVKNNYFWLADDSSIGFIANGEMLLVKRVLRREELYGFRFAEVTVQFVDYPQEVERDILVLLDTLDVEGPNLPREEMKKLFFAVEQDYLDEHNKRKRYEKILKNPHFNALQVKYAYAVTCHKSQGGQWSNVFLDQGYLTEEMLDAGYFRWLYTALTRATDRVYLMNFKDEFFGEGN